MSLNERSSRCRAAASICFYGRRDLFSRFRESPHMNSVDLDVYSESLRKYDRRKARQECGLQHSPSI